MITFEDPEPVREIIGLEARCKKVATYVLCEIDPITSANSRLNTTTKATE